MDENGGYYDTNPYPARDVADEQGPAAPPARRRRVGPVTTAAAGGSALGTALAALAVWGLNLAGVDAAAVEVSLAVVITAGLTTLAGFLARSR